MAVQTVIIADLTTNCGYAKINDESIYSAAPDSRSDFGIVIFVKENGTLNYLLSDFTNSDPWFIPIVNHSAYSIEAYQVPVWTPKLWFHNSIVYDNNTGTFWHQSNVFDAPAGEVPHTGSAYWVQITNDIIGWTLFDSFATNDAIITVQQDCPDYSIIRKECDDFAVCCKTHTLCDNSGNTDIKTVALFDYNGVFIENKVLDPAKGLCVDITVPDQGVYIVAISEYSLINDNQNISEYSDYLVIYEYCQLQHCAQYLIDQILCSNDPCTEICNPCDTSKIIAQNKARAELNRMIGLFFSLLGMINAEKIRYLDVFTYDTTRANFITKIGMQMLKVNEISIRCGICTGTTVKATDNEIFQDVIQQSTARTSGCTECQ